MKVHSQHSFQPLLARAVLAAVLLLTGGTLLAQPTVRGQVTDADGKPVPGVFVMVVGTDNGTMTDADGRYTISVDRGDVLAFECLGMTTVQQVCDGSVSTLNVTLQEDTTYLDEVVVVGYGSQRKSSLTSAVSAIKGDDLLKAPSTNVSQLLAGRLTGVSSVQESGEPGDDFAALKIRGSRYGVAYVVDGFPVNDINDIDPNDVESVSVLKDGASAAVYGLQAAGGVIIVTTKKGEAGRPRITYSNSLGASFNANFPQFMDGPQFAYWWNMADMMDQLGSGTLASRYDYVPYYTQENIAAMTDGDPTDGWDNVDYIKKVFGTGFTQKHNITVTGGGERSKYFVSAGYLGQKGNIDGYNYRRYNVRANLESKIADRLTFTGGINGVIGKREAPRFISGGTDGTDVDYEVGWFSLAHQAIEMHPYLPETYEGLYTGFQPFNQRYPSSPLAALHESGSRKTDSFDGSVNATLQWDLPWVEGLSLKAGGSYSYSAAHNKNITVLYNVMQKFRNAETGAWEWSKATDPNDYQSDGNTLGEGATFSNQLVGQASVNFVRAFGEHHLDAMLLAEVRRSEGNNLLAYAKNLPFASLPELSTGIPSTDPVAVGGGSYESRSAGYVFRARYDYADKYLAELTGRYDGSYKFAGMTGTRWGFFPSLSLGWRLSKEDFMQPVSIIDDLKVRGSVGLLGNDSVSEFMFLSTYSKQDDNVVYPAPSGNTTTNPAYYPSGIPNTDLTWEKTLSWNFGYDLTMWGGLLGMEVDAFYNYTYDILTNLSVSGSYPASMGGYHPTWANANAIDSKGIDILVSHRNSFSLLGKPFYYGATATLTYAKTRWLKYQDDPNIPEWQKHTGKSIYAISGLLADGLYRTEEEIDESAWATEDGGLTRPWVGFIKYVDLNGDGRVDNADYGLFGRSNRPELTYGLNLNFAWNGFDFNAQFTGGALFDVSLTGTYFNGYDDQTIWTQTFKEGANSPLYMVENAYSIDNPDGTFPRITLNQDGHAGQNGWSSSFWWRDGKYLRLKSAQLGYTIPAKLTRRAGVENLRLYVEGQNLFTLSGLPKGIDPESPGVNNGYYPQQRLVMGGVSITF